MAQAQAANDLVPGPIGNGVIFWQDRSACRSQDHV
jgi:hypothetical protein